jgi:arylsulfate sulfotransferase
MEGPLLCVGRPGLQATERKNNSHKQKITPETKRFSSGDSPGRTAKAMLLFVAVLAIAMASPGLTIISGPTFTPAGANAPLAGTLQLATDLPSRVSVAVNDGVTNWQRDFFDFGTNHSVPLYGFRPARTNEITVTLVDQQRNAITAPQLVAFISSPLPTNFPNLTLFQSQPNLMEPGYTLFRAELHTSTNGYAIILNSGAEVIWYGIVPATADLRMLSNGDLFMPCVTNFQEFNLLGNQVNAWLVPTNLLIEVDAHEGVPTDHGTFLYLSDATETISNYPTSVTVSNAPLATATISYQKVVEISATNASLLNTWSPITQLDPRRISYLVARIGTVWDSEHANAIIEDPSDDSLIVSMRSQNAVIKFSRATGQLKWILGPPDNWGVPWQPFLLTPVGTPFAWEYGQHAPVFTPQGTLLMFDDGNFRASPYATSVPDANNYSRAVEYQINEDTMEVTQVWDYGRTNEAYRLYVDHEGNAEPEPQTGNVLIDFSAVKYINGVAPSSFGPSAYVVRLTEVTHDPTPQVVFDLEVSEFANTNSPFKDCTAYRAHRIPDLYAHPAASVGDLALLYNGTAPTLQFSADPARTYVVQTSTDLASWQTIGTATPDDLVAGGFQFQDTQSVNLPERYYRIVTQ